MNAKNKAVIRNKELCLLDLISFLINYSGINNISDKQKSKLTKLYYQILNKYSKILCKNLPCKNFETASTLLQEFYEQECIVYPPINKIYWWQEPTYDNDEDVTVCEPGFFTTKLHDTETNFITGVDCSFTELGRILFAILDSEETDTYEIYDAFGNQVTHTFQQLYSECLHSRIFISNNIYAPCIMNFKIKKI